MGEPTEPARKKARTTDAPPVPAPVSAVPPAEPFESDEQFNKAVHELEDVQNAIEKTYDEAAAEVLSIEQKFYKKRKPLFVKRNELLHAVPEFWLMALCNNEKLNQLVTEDDTKALKFLRDVVVEEADDIKSGFTICMKFEKNPFFENEVLTKQFKLSDEGIEIVPTEIRWKPKQNFSAKLPKPTEDPDSQPFPGLILWMGSDDPLIEVADIIKDEIWPDPMKSYNADLAVEEADEEGEPFAEDAEPEEDDGQNQ